MLSVRAISKRFGNVQALADVSLDFVAGEIHCILGENGAGKSTLMHILDGVLRPDAGDVVVDGRVLHLTSPRAARSAGIGMVHQHFTLIDAMTVAENLALSIPVQKGLEDRGWGLGEWRLNRAAIAARASSFAERVGLALPPADQYVRELSVGARQRLEILKALLAAGKVLILDEPTAVLTPSEVDQLFELLRALRAQQRLVIFITHKLREVKAVGDRVTIMRRGRVVATHEVASVSEMALAEEMIGAVLPGREAPARVPAEAGVAVTLEHVSTAGTQGSQALVDINLQVRAGEILGIAGVDGNGQRELFEVLAGLQTPSVGIVRIGDPQAPDIQPLTPQSAHAAGIASIPPDRHREGLALPMSVVENFLLSSTVLQRFSRRGFLNYAAARRFAARAADQFAIRSSSLDQPTRELSGGNQQRIVVARELSQQPRLVAAVNPTRGLDVQATQAVAAAIRDAAARGGAVILISTELDELLELSHRIAVLFRGGLGTPIEPPFDTTVLGRQMAGAPG